MVVQELAPTARKAAHLSMSYEEFLDWIDEDTRAEWVDGEVIIHMPPKDFHQTMVEFLFRLLGLFVDLFQLGKVRVAPFEVKLWPGGPAREPDIFFITREHLDQLTEDRLLGAPDLIIEVISRDSVTRDRDDKFKEYQKASVREYWLIDPRPGKQRADFYRLNEQAQYELIGTEDDDWLTSQVLPGFRLQPAWLWRADSLAPLTAALATEGVKAALNQQITDSEE